MSEIFQTDFPLTEDVVVTVGGKKAEREDYHLDLGFDHVSFAGRMEKDTIIEVHRPQKTQTFKARGA